MSARDQHCRSTGYFREDGFVSNPAFRPVGICVRFHDIVRRSSMTEIEAQSRHPKSHPPQKNRCPTRPAPAIISPRVAPGRARCSLLSSIQRCTVDASSPHGSLRRRGLKVTVNRAVARLYGTLSGSGGAPGRPVSGHERRLSDAARRFPAAPGAVMARAVPAGE